MKALPEHMQHLPVVKGRPVPWVTRWSEEAAAVTSNFRDSIAWVNVEGIDVPVPDATKALRAKLGRPEIGRGDLGEVQWAFVESRRAFDSMMMSLCHVCGARMSADDWLVRAWDGQHTPQGAVNQGSPARGKKYVISEAPVCEPCAEFSATVCPALTRPPVFSWWRAKRLRVVGALASRVAGDRVEQSSEPWPALKFAEWRARGGLAVAKQPLGEVRLVRPFEHVTVAVRS